MFKGFNLRIASATKFSNAEQDSLSWLNTQKKTWSDYLKKFTQNEIVDATKLQDAWFEQRQVDVFISHSHSDIQLAASFATWLRVNFGLTSFVDSAVWGNASTLQKQLDDAYTGLASTRSYNYEESNRVCAHVNMMLCGALSAMLDRSECVIFLNTPKSIVTKDSIKDPSSSLTASPWIYYELLTTKYIEKKKPRRPLYDSVALVKSMKKTATDRSLNMLHKAEIEHLIDLNLSDLTTWQGCQQRSTAALDFLYDLKS